jgi:hypothetical protein
MSVMAKNLMTALRQWLSYWLILHITVAVLAHIGFILHSTVAARLVLCLDLFSKPSAYLQVDGGILVAASQPGLPAHKAGIQVGDVIVGFDGASGTPSRAAACGLFIQFSCLHLLWTMGLKALADGKQPPSILLRLARVLETCCVRRRRPDRCCICESA